MGASAKKTNSFARFARQHSILEEAVGQKPDVGAVFLLVAQNQGISVGEIANRLDLPQSTVSRYIKDMRVSAPIRGSLKIGKVFEAKIEAQRETSELIVQEIDPEHPRRTALRLSKKGEALVRKILEAG